MLSSLISYRHKYGKLTLHVEIQTTDIHFNLMINYGLISILLQYAFGADY